MMKIGDKVKIHVPKEKTGNTVRKLNGQEAVIRRISGWTNGTCYYELYGIESEAGIPYCFVEDWLQPVE